MTLVVVGVTGATLYVASNQVRDTYRKLFEDQFKQQRSYFSESRIRELEEVARKCDDLVKKVRVFSALEEALNSNDPDTIYDALETELQLSPLGKGPDQPPPLLRKFQEGQRPRGPNSPKLPGNVPPNVVAKLRERIPLGLLYSVVDSEGRVLVPKMPRPNFMPPQNMEGRKPRNRQDKFPMFINHAPSEAVKEQEIGYLPMKREAERQRQLHEIIVTPIFLEKEGVSTSLGALVIGYPVRDFGEKAMYDFSGKTLLSGIWLADKVYSTTVPEELREDVAVRVGEEIKHASSGTSVNLVDVNGVPHRMFFEVLNPDSIFPAAVQVCLYSMQEALTEQAALRAKVLTFGMLALLIGIAFILFISHGFSKPVEQLAAATQKIREGDFTVKVPVTTKDEFGTLAASFNSMTEDLALKERYKVVLAQVTDKEVAEQLISGEMSLGGEVKQVSVLFCDIRGFTALTERMPPAEVITMLNEHMTAMNRIVHKHYGMVDKFVGDLIMAVFGAPKSYGNDALHAVKCAMKMMEERKRLNETTKHSFEIGIGVATGEVVAGCMGSEDRLNYTVLGDRVNLASRLCSKAGRTELLIDETTYEKLPPGFLVEATEPMPLKGFSNLVPAYRLLETDGADLDEAEPVSPTDQTANMLTPS